MIRPLLIAALMIVPALPAPAQRIRANPAPAPAPTPGVAPLTLDEVLRASARAAPQIVEALAKIRAAEGRAITASGAFDTVFEADGRSRALGYYDGTIAAARATQPLGGRRFPIFPRKDEAVMARHSPRPLIQVAGQALVRCANTSGGRLISA